MENAKENTGFWYRYPRPAVAVDVVIFRKTAGRLELLLIRRAQEPFQGCWALPGGFLDPDEELDDAARRELAEEAGLTSVPLHRLGVFDRPDRDPRHRTISMAYWGILPTADAMPVAGDDADSVRWFPADASPPLAFDHADIVNRARKTLHNEGS